MLRTKNAVSLPSSAARAISSASDSPSANSSLTASKTAVPSDEPRAEGHALAEADSHPVHAVMPLHQPERLETDVLPGSAVHGQPFGAELRAGRSGAHHLHLVIKARNGEHDGFQIVKPVRTTAQDVETQIYFAVCMQDHTAKI